MDTTFQEKCLEAHRDLLKLEREVHRWLNELTGMEVGADRPRRERPPEWRSPDMPT